MSTLADVLADLLLPGSLRRAPGRLGPQGCVWYQVGAEFVKALPDLGGGSGREWASVPPAERAVPKERRGETCRIADLLWDGAGGRLDRLRSCRPFLAVADPAANVVTLSWLWRPDSRTDRRSIDDLRRLLGSRVEAFLGEVPALTRRLFQRPALHLVLLGGDTAAAPPELERVVREILAQTGPYFPDLQVRWQQVRKAQEGKRAFLRRLLGFHLPWPVWPRGEVRHLSGQPVDALAAALQHLSEVLQRLDRDRPDPFEAVSELRPVVAELQGLTLSEPGDGSGPRPAQTPPPSPEEMILGVQLCARHWQATPVLMPLAPLTLVAGDNASGKTSFTEALSLAFTGLARPRAPQPSGAPQWRDARGQTGPGSPSAAPSLSVIRLALDSASSWGELRSHELLALFADDADLAAANPGDLSIVTWLGFPGLRMSSPSAGSSGADVAPLLAQAFDRFAAIEQARIEEGWSRETGKPPRSTRRGRHRNRGVQLPEWLARALRTCLEEERDKLMAEEAIEAETGKTAGSARAEYKQATLETRKRRLKLDKDLAKISEDVAGQPTPAALAEPWLDLLAGAIGNRPGGPEAWTGNSGETWSDLKALDLAVGGKTAIEGLARKRMSALISDAKSKLAELSQDLADVLFSGDLEQFERAIREFLAQQIQADEPAGLKPNTAAVVRMGQASRLARWLAVSGVDWPLLVIDEPTLGQDEASCARALVRYLRLMRRAEAARWLAHDPAASEALTASVEKVTVGDLERWSTDRSIGGHGRGNAETRRGNLDLEIELRPLPPQALVLSYRESALAVVADLEGTILDHEVKKNLQKLIPNGWHEPIGRSLREAHQAIEEALSGLLPEAGRSVPATLLRAAWKPPFGDLRRQSKDADWLKRAKEALCALGAIGMAEEVEKADDADFRLLAWLLHADLLPAALAEGDEYFQAGTLTLRRLPGEGGMAKEEGPIRLRRLLPIQDQLPPLPASWRQQIVPRLPRAETEVSREPFADTTPDQLVAGTGPRGVGVREDRRGGPFEPGATQRPGVWRVALIGEATASFPASTELVRLGIEAAGFESVPAPGEAEVRIDLQAREAGLAPVELKWELDLPGGETHRPDWELQPASIDRLLDFLVRARVRALEAVGDAETPVEIVLATYNLRELPTRGAAFRFVLDLEAEDDPGSRRRRLDEVFSGGLKRLRQGLAESPTTRKLRFYPRCGLSVALRAGSIFHRASGFQVECEQNGQLWATDRRGAPPTDAVVEHVGAAETSTSPELHILVSISRDVRPQYETWRRAGGREGLALQLTRSTGPGQAVIRGVDDLAGWAALIPKVIAAHQAQIVASRPKEKEWPLRFFLSTPAALAVAIGRQLNAHGRIIAMEHDKAGLGGYFEAFDFRA